MIVLTHAALARAIPWQWSVEDTDAKGANARIFLWIPEGCSRVRGVVLGNHNMLEQGIFEHPTMRATLTELGFAEVWAVPKLDHVFDPAGDAPTRFQRVMDKLAEESGYDELKTVPIVPMGHSANATWPWNFAAWNPQRTLCVLSIHGDAPRTNLTGFGGKNPDWGDRSIDGVPGLMVMSEFEWWEDRLTPAIKFKEKHPASAVALLADAGRGHFDYSDQLVSFLAMFVKKSAERRLPLEWPASLDTPPTLRSVDPSSGWLIDRWRKDQTPASPAAPFNAYAGPRAEAFWCFDEEMARATESYYSSVRGKKPQLVAFAQDGKLLAGEPCSPIFRPLDDGVSFTLSAQFLESVSGEGDNPEKWAGLPKGAPLGHATGGGPIVISKIVGPVRKIDDKVFALSPDRLVSVQDRRNDDVWLLASHPGDDQYKSAVQQARIRLIRNTDGEPQEIRFPLIPDQTQGVDRVQLAAKSTAGLPVAYCVREGPAEVDGDMLQITSIPPRTRWPVRVTVVAWQWGRPTMNGQAGVKTAEPVTQSFLIQRANPRP